MYSDIVNLDLLSVGIATAAIGIIGFMLYFSNRQSITNRTFLFFTFSAIGWSVFNYINYQFDNPTLVLWLLRCLMFSAVWLCFFLFQLLYVFPKESIQFPKEYKRALIPLVFLTSILTLTPFLFTRIVGSVVAGQVAEVERGPALIFFALIVVYLIVGAIVQLVKKTIIAEGEEKKQFRLILIGIIITFTLLVGFNFILPAFFSNFRFIPFGAVFILPLIISIFYSIRRGLLNVKIISTEASVFVLTIASFIEVVVSESVPVLLLRSSVFVLVLTVGVLLIRSVIKEVEQREKIETLATELDKANDRMKEFLSLATHQIRAPLAAIRGYASEILEDDFGAVPQPIRETIEIIANSSKELNHTVQDFLDVSRLEQNSMKYDYTDFDVNDLVGTIVKELRTTIEKKNLALQINLAPGPLTIKADKGKIQQTLTNVIDNSSKYTSTGGITISTEKKDGAVRVIVKDTGVGIRADVLPKLFQKFSRAEEATKANILGTGLGLYLARQLVEAQGGKIWAESGGEGKGSTFVIELKVSA